MMNLHKRLVSVAATTALALGAGLVATQPAEAAGISCGQAFYDSQLEGVVHSCDGTGLIKYTIDCVWPPDVQFTYRWEQGASRVFNYTCQGRSEWAVNYTVLE